MVVTFVNKKFLAGKEIWSLEQLKTFEILEGKPKSYAQFNANIKIEKKSRSFAYHKIEFKAFQYHLTIPSTSFLSSSSTNNERVED